MSKSKSNFKSMDKVGNFTKKAVESFEENIVTQTNYLDNIKK